MPHLKSQTQWQTEMSVKIIDFIISELYADMRFFHLALSSLVPKTDPALQTFATDGISILYSPERILRIFENNSRFLNRCYLHSILHCIFSHLWLRGNRGRTLWNLACDIAVEYTIDKMEKPCTKRILSWLRKQVYDKIEQDMTHISASVIYRYLCSLNEEQVLQLQKEFYTDDHRFWPQPDSRASSANQKAKNQWQKIARQTRMQQELHEKDQTKGERTLSAQLKAEKNRRSYHDFLSKFTILREELHCDPEEFDLNFYTYGLRLYGNMPLIEPVETRETKKIHEFVIVIDTSDSTSGDLVKNFLRETFQILRQREYFFDTCKIRILQCDDRVRSDTEITSLHQAEQFLSEFTMTGGGGTNFCPAFSYVSQLMENGIFKDLRGLLYFTDGLGIYPKKRPPYQTAFLFLTDYDESKIPPWAMRIRLEPEEFLSAKKITGGIYEY